MKKLEVLNSGTHIIFYEIRMRYKKNDVNKIPILYIILYAILSII